MLITTFQLNERKAIIFPALPAGLLLSCLLSYLSGVCVCVCGACVCVCAGNCIFHNTMKLYDALP